MKLLANLILAIALALGALSAVSAYRPLVALDGGQRNDQLIGLTYNGDQGIQLSEDIVATLDQDDNQRELLQQLLLQPNDEARLEVIRNLNPESPLLALDTVSFFEPIAKYSDDPGAENKITNPLLTQLRDSGVERVTVKEFSVTRWEHWWLMLLSIAGLVLAAIMLRAQRPKPSAIDSETDSTETPSSALEVIDRTLTSVRAAVHDESDERVALQRIVHDLGELQLGPIDTIVNAREQFVATHGLTAYAVFMDQFSALERKVNRAWSTAADNHLPESTRALEDAISLIESVKSTIPA